MKNMRLKLLLLKLTTIILLVATQPSCDLFQGCSLIGGINSIEFNYEAPVDFYHSVELANYRSEDREYKNICDESNSFYEDALRFSTHEKRKPEVLVIVRDEMDNVLLEEEFTLHWKDPFYPNGKDCDDEPYKSANITLPTFEPIADDESSAL